VTSANVRAARALGHRTYFTGKPCRRGHLAERITANKTCVECRKLWARKYQRSAGEHISRLRKNRPREWKDRVNAERRADPNKKAKQLKHKYGLTLERYEAMLAAQNNLCACCLHQFNGTPHVDHCHVTGVVRGLLCAGCNKGIGHFDEQIGRLFMAMKYLGRWQGIDVVKLVQRP
jgi:hypothetical protein